MKKSCPKCCSIDVKKIDDMAELRQDNNKIKYQEIGPVYKCFNCGRKGPIK